MAAGALIAAIILVRLTSAGELQLAHRVVHLPDVAIVTGLEAEAANRIVIAELAGPHVTISRKDLARLIERAVPASRVTGALSGSIRILAPVPAPPAQPASYVDEPQVSRGDRLTVTSRVGPVVVERLAIALQDATRRQKKLFVTTADGEVFAAPVTPEARK